MKNIGCYFPVLIVILLLSFSQSLTAQYLTSKHFTRGADTAEIYLSCQWYADQHLTWSGIFRSNDNGLTLTVQSKIKWYSGMIFGDSLPGALFQVPIHGIDTLGISFDFGKTFEEKHCPEIYARTAGCMAGELYISGWGLYRGTGYGDTFTWQSDFDSLNLQEVGTQPGELFWFKTSYEHGPLGLAFSNDYGQTYSLSLINFPGIPYFCECTLHRGTLPGELYFVVRKNTNVVDLFHSFDYGQTLEFKSEHFFIASEIWFTAGRTPGSFYYAEREICGYFDHSCLTIYFSRDYGETFTKFYHELDSTYTGVEQKDMITELDVFPNPASERLTFRHRETMSDEDTRITLFDLFGKPVSEGLLPKGQQEVNIPTGYLPAGFYTYMLTNRKMTKSGKIVITR